MWCTIILMDEAVGQGQVYHWQRCPRALQFCVSTANASIKIVIASKLIVGSGRPLGMAWARLGPWVGCSPVTRYTGRNVIKLI